MVTRTRRTILLACVAALCLGALAGTTGQTRAHAAGTVCKDVLFVAVRGSGENGDKYNNGWGERIPAVWDAFKARIGPSRDWHGVSLDYPADSTEMLWKPGSLNPGMYMAHARQGADTLVAMLKAYRQDCKSDIVLAGYSSGAMVIRLAMQNANLWAGRNAGVALLADPASDPGSDGFRHHGEQTKVGVARPLYTKETFPPNVFSRGQYVSFCAPNDFVCAARGNNPLQNPAHGEYAANGSATMAGRMLADGVLRLPDPYPNASPPPPAAPPPPPATPRYPDGNFVSTCNLGGSATCTGANLRNIPQRPGNVTGVLGELTQVQPLCATHGTPTADRFGKSTDIWWWVRASNGAMGYVSEMFIFGPGYSGPWCDQRIYTAADSTFAGSARHGGTAHITFPVRQHGYHTTTLHSPRALVQGPGGYSQEAGCEGPPDVQLAYRQSWDCRVNVHFPLNGSYTITFMWNDPAGRPTDGRPLWGNSWSWTVGTAPPHEPVGNEISGDGAYDYNSHTLETKIQNAANNAIQISPYVRFLGQQLPCDGSPTVTVNPGEVYTCRAKLPFNRKGNYDVQMQYTFGGQTYSPYSGWTIDIPETILKPTLTLVGYSINTPDPVYASSALDAEFTVRSTGRIPARFIPMVFSDPLLYGEFGQCQGMDYTSFDAAIQLEPGAIYRCVTHGVLTEDALGEYRLSAGAYLLNAEDGQDIVEFPMAKMQVHPRPAPTPEIAARPAPTVNPSKESAQQAERKQTLTVATVIKHRRAIRIRVAPDPARDPGRWKVTVQKQHKRGKHLTWRSVRKLKTDRDGRVVYKPTLRSSSATYRVRTASQAGFVGSASKTVKTRGR